MRMLNMLGGLAVSLMPGVVAAQKLTAGTWTGTINPPNGQVINAAFDVKTSGDTTLITLKADGRELNFTGVKVEADRLLFTFATDAIVTCTLQRKEDKSYSGSCVDGRGSSGTIVMIPPKS
jgi:hypothetical protein